MEGVAVIAVYTMVTIDVCATIWIGKIFAGFIYKVIRLINQDDEEK